ncbi:MAG: hypothetical protein FJ096_20950 [Deltaproteobacteria bacterium]|nr:hypothetical protein [Deltaproteobacteria bacterium]
MPNLPSSLAARAPFVLAAALHVIAGCSSPANSGDDDDIVVDQFDATASGGSVFTLRRDARKCAAPACGGYFVARPNRPTTTCADGKPRAECYVAAVDLAPSGLTATQQETVLAAVSPTSAFVRVLVRGVMKRGPTVSGVSHGTLSVTEAHLAPEVTTLSGTLHRISTASNCPAKSCTVLRQQDANTSTTRGLSFLDVTALGGGSASNGALAGAYSTTGLLALGKTEGDSGSRVMKVSQVFERVVPGAPLCGAALDSALASAAKGWLWMSESDYPVVPFAAEAPASSPLTEDDVRALVGADESKPVDERSLAVFEGVGRNEPGMAPEEVELAVRYRRLRHLLESNLTDVRVFYVGEVELDVVIVGRTACGKLAGVRTIAIET